MTCNTTDNDKVRLYIRMDCGEDEAMIAGEWFNELGKKLRMRFPAANIQTRQGLKAYVLQEGDPERGMFLRLVHSDD